MTVANAASGFNAKDLYTILDKDHLHQAMNGDTVH